MSRKPSPHRRAAQRLVARYGETILGGRPAGLEDAIVRALRDTFQRGYLAGRLDANTDFSPPRRFS